MKTSTHHITRLLFAALFAACSTIVIPSARAQEEQKPSAEAKEPARDPNRLWCEEHEAYEDECFICHPELREKGRLWCKEHDRYEDRCWLCHPEMEDKDRLWCKEHSLYEDECFICHPELKKSGKTEPESESATEQEAAAGERDPKRLWCQEHSVYEDECYICHPELEKAQTGAASGGLFCKEHSVAEAECGICHPELTTNLAPGEGMQIRFASAQSAERAGVQTAPPAEGPISASVESFAEISYNQNKLAQISTLVSGIVESVEVDLGTDVEEGAVLARIRSIEISEATSAYLRALVEVELSEQGATRERRLRERKISPEKDLQEAEAGYKSALADVQQARQKLAALGFDEAQIESLPKRAATDGSVLEVRAPFAGEIIQRDAVKGGMTEPGKPLFTLTDCRVKWAMLSVPETEVAHLRLGQQVELSVDALPGQTFTGTITWIASQVDDRTRMATVRAEVPDPESRLKANMFARARVLMSTASNGLTVPQSAVQQIEGKPFVFVKAAADLYEARAVRLGARHQDRLQIAEGVQAGEEIVMARSFILKSELLKSRLGAGCVDD